MHTQRIDMTTYFTRGALLLATLVLFGSFTMTAHADHPRDNSAYQVDTLLDKTVETLVIMQESVGTEYDYTKKKETTEYYDYTKKQEYVEPEYKKQTAYSEANIEQLLVQIQQLQKLIMLLLQLQQLVPDHASPLEKAIEKQSEKSTTTPTTTIMKGTVESVDYTKKKEVY